MIQFIRGNTAANDGYVGPVGSLSADTEAGNIRLHDGVTAGGWVIANVDDTGSVKTISASSPLIISGTLENPVIEIQAATPTQDGYMSAADKSKLDGIESGAEVNVQPDWSATSGDAQILNKPALGSAAFSESSSFATAAQGTRADEAHGWGDHSAAGYEQSSNKGVANGYAGLDAGGKVPAGQLPSFVEDVLEFSSFSAFPATGESGKIYVAIDNGKTYRWGGSSYTEISSGDVNSVNGQTGVVVLDTGDVAESGNLYFTTARARSAISVSGDLSYSGGVISFNETYSTPAEIKTAYESNANTNAFTDAEKSKLAGVEAGAQANSVDSVNGQTGTVVIPNANSTTAGLVSTGDQTFSGNKTFSGIVTIDEGAI
mgnify:CR=1 FL=1